MVRSTLLYLIGLVCAACVAAVLAGCVASPDRNADDQRERCDDCVQPKLVRADLVEHLQREQERILARDDYKNNIPPPVSDVISAGEPRELWRDGPDIVDDDGQDYDGELNWHHIAFDEVSTEGVDHNSLRGRDATGAHCYFAHQPNRYTAIFSLVVLHHRDRGDVFYQGGPYLRINRIDTVPLTDRQRSPIRVSDDHIWCAFRSDRNNMGALVIPIEFTTGSAGSDRPKYALFTVVTGGERRPTGESMVIERPVRSRSRETVEERVPVKKYPDPRTEFIDVFHSPHDALKAAEEVIPPGRFRLRPAFVYPAMTYKSHLDTDAEEFCPARVQCVEEREHFDADILPPPPTLEEPPEQADDDE